MLARGSKLNRVGTRRCPTLAEQRAHPGDSLHREPELAPRLDEAEASREVLELALRPAVGLVEVLEGNERVVGELPPGAHQHLRVDGRVVEASLLEEGLAPASRSSAASLWPATHSGTTESRALPCWNSASKCSS